MKSHLIVALAISISVADTAAQGRRERGAEPELKHFTSKVVDFESKALGGRDAVYRVFLPAGYDDEKNADTRYPIVFWLHGMWEDHERFFRRGGAEALDAMADAEEIPALIVVCANADRASFYINSTNPRAHYEDLIVDDLVAHCDATYRIRADRGARAIAGVSMGGYGALKIAFKHPDRFGIVAAHSAALLPKDPATLDDAFPWLERMGGSKRALQPIFGDATDRKKWDEENMLLIAEQIDPERLNGLKIYFDCGDADPYGFFGPNKELRSILETREIDHTWTAVAEGKHGWRYNQAAIPNSLRFIAAGFAVDRAKSGLGTMLGAKPDGEKDKLRK